MLARLFSVQRHELRYIALLGGFAFFQLAATTILGAASEALFINAQGAKRLAYGIILGQVLAIAGFFVYRLMRQHLTTRLLNPAVVTLLAIGLGTVYYFVVVGSSSAFYVLIALGPLYASVLASEYGRISAAVIDARSARRLLPMLGALGGLGATLGAFLVRTLTPIVGSEALLAISAVTMLLVAIPASGVRESMRPRVTSRLATSVEVLKNGYALALIGGAVLLIGISTLVRIQFGAAAEASYSADQLTVFYADFYFVLNVISIFFTLFISKALVNLLGAARSLLIYPSLLLSALATSIVIPGLWAITATQFIERLFRQNIHSANAAIVGMPLPVGVRVQMSLMLNGTIKPIAVVIASAATLVTIGEFALPAWQLQYTQLAWPIGLLSLGLLVIMWRISRRYGAELQKALHARRLQLAPTSPDESSVIDPQLRLILHGYLASDLPERCALALELLKQDPHQQTFATIRRQWPLWEDWLKLQAIDSLVQDPEQTSQTFLMQLDASEPDEVRAKVIMHYANDYNAHDLWALVNSGANATSAQALAALAARGDENSNPKISATLEDWLIAADASTDSVAKAAAATLQWPTPTYDEKVVARLAQAPTEVLALMHRRPQPGYASLCIPYLSNDATYPTASATLQKIGEPSVAKLETAAVDPAAPNASFGVLAGIEGPAAHLASMRLMAHGQQMVRHRATAARLNSAFALSSAENQLVTENLEASLATSERFHSYQHQENPLFRNIAINERNAALEDVFLNLTLAEVAKGSRQPTYRQAYLAQQSHDKKQRAFALELLDQLLPRQIKRRLLPILEDQPAGKSADMQADHQWLQLTERLMQGSVQGNPLHQLAMTDLFRHWRVTELEALATNRRDSDDVALLLRNGSTHQLEQTLLKGTTPEPQEGDGRISLNSIYQVIREQPRCGPLWLQQLASRVPQAHAEAIDVTRSTMVSLASRTLGDDHDASSDLDLWQRMFFLRSCTFTQDLPTERLRLVAKISRSLQAKPGETVVHEGRLGNHFYLVCSGRLQVSSAGKNLSELGPSDGFGALSLMRGERRSLSVKALEACELLAISRVDFLDLIEVHPGLVRSLSRTLAAQILAAQGSA